MRRNQGETVHDYQHRLIAARWAQYDALPTKGPLAAYKRREAYKLAHNTLVGHLRDQHHMRGMPLAHLSRAVLDSRHPAV